MVTRVGGACSWGPITPSQGDGAPARPFLGTAYLYQHRLTYRTINSARQHVGRDVFLEGQARPIRWGGTPAPSNFGDLLHTPTRLLHTATKF